MNGDDKNMDISNVENFKIITYDVNNVHEIYIFIANDGYVFYNEEQNNNDDKHYVTLFKEELDKLSNYKCIERTHDMIIL